MRRNIVEEIDKPPHPRGDIGWRIDPAAAQSAQPVDLGQTAGDDKVAPEMERRSRPVGPNTIEVDLVDKYMGAMAGGNFSDSGERTLRGKSAGRIVEIRKHDEFGARRHQTRK